MFALLNFSAFVYGAWTRCCKEMYDEFPIDRRGVWGEF